MCSCTAALGHAANTNPVLSLKMAGRTSLMYVQLQMNSKTTIRNDWKSNNADI